MKDLVELGLIPADVKKELDEAFNGYIKMQIDIMHRYKSSMVQRYVLGNLVEEFMALYERETDDYLPDYSGLYKKCRNAYGFDLEEQEE